MNPRNRASSLSKREKIRRYPFSRRNSRSISLRLLYHLLVVLPGFVAVALGRNDRVVSQVEGQLPGVVAFIGTVHHQEPFLVLGAQAVEQPTSLRGVVGLAG